VCGCRAVRHKEKLSNPTSSGDACMFLPPIPPSTLESRLTTGDGNVPRIGSGQYEMRWWGGRCRACRLPRVQPARRGKRDGALTSTATLEEGDAPPHLRKPMTPQMRLGKWVRERRLSHALGRPRREHECASIRESMPKLFSRSRVGRLRMQQLASTKHHRRTSRAGRSPIVVVFATEQREILAEFVA
jgi:hypothetical protein